MVETLEHLIRRAARDPRSPRAALYREMLRSETYLLSVDKPLAAPEALRVTRAEESFPVWAERDSETGGVWIPLFPSRDAVLSYVSSQKLQTPAGKEFLWMGHRPGAVFPLLRGVRCFAGVRLCFDADSWVPLGWSEVKALAEGRLPPDRPLAYELPVARLVLPPGLRLAFGRVCLEGRGRPGRLLIAPEAGRFRPEDLRRLVRLPLGEGDEAWTPCRHFLQVLRLISGEDKPESSRYLEDLLCSLIGFEMFGEAEALCDWLTARGREAYAWVALAAVYAKTERHAECAELCRRGARKYPSMTSFPVTGARALSALGKKDEAQELLLAAIQRAPQDPQLLEALRELLAAAS